MAENNLISVKTLGHFLAKIRTLFANAVHTHSISDVTGLNTAITGKADVVHTHLVGDVSGLQTALNGKQDAGDYLTAETDPTVPSWVKSITEEQITGWDNAASGEIEETDPTVPSYVKSIQQTDITKWNSALQTESDPTVPSWAKQESKPTYTYSEVGAAPTEHDHEMADVSGLTAALATKQDAGDYLLSSELPAWVTSAGQSKPTYTYNEVGAAPASTATDLSQHTSNATIHVTSEQKTAWDAKADTEDIPTSLKNPNAISFNVNGSTTSYDGSEAKTVTLNLNTLGVDTALQNKANKPITTTTTAATSDWNNEAPYRTTGYSVGATSTNDLVFVAPTPDYITKWAEFGLYAAQDADGKVYITTTKDSKPNADVQFNIAVFK